MIIVCSRTVTFKPGFKMLSKSTFLKSSYKYNFFLKTSGRLTFPMASFQVENIYKCKRLWKFVVIRPNVYAIIGKMNGGYRSSLKTFIKSYLIYLHIVFGSWVLWRSLDDMIAGFRMHWLYLLHKSKTPPNGGVLGMDPKCIWWWDLGYHYSQVHCDLEW